MSTDGTANVPTPMMPTTMHAASDDAGSGGPADEVEMLPKPEPLEMRADAPNLVRSKMGARKLRFVEVWNRSANVREVSAVMGIAPNSAHTLASRYRKQGVLLKPMPLGRPKVGLESPAHEAAFESLPRALRDAAIEAATKVLLRDATLIGRAIGERERARQKALAKGARRGSGGVTKGGSK